MNLSKNSNKERGFIFPIILVFIILSFVVGVGGVYFYNNSLSKNEKIESLKNIFGNDGEKVSPTSDAVPGGTKEDKSVVAEGLDTPWALAFLPNGDILITERKGTVRLVKSGVLVDTPIAEILASKETGEGGLMGIAVHPDFDFTNNKFVYLYYTYGESGINTLNRVVKMKFENETLIEESIIVNEIPGASNHDGGRIRFGPDGYLYITTGDAQEPSLAQDINSLAGKILRVDGNGNKAPGNQFENQVYTFGHRNPQGIAWDSNGQLWSTEHGPSGGQSGNDELNRVDAGKNYGWPDIKGYQKKEGMEAPVLESGTVDVWAPAGLAFIDGRFFFAGLRGNALYETDANGKNLKTHFKGMYGRIREVLAGPDGYLYISTSNKDGRGSPKTGDDKILRIDPSQL